MEVTTADISNEEVTNVETSRMEESVRNAKQTLVTLREELELMKQTHLEQVEKLTNQMDSHSFVRSDEIKLKDEVQRWMNSMDSPQIL